MHICLAPKPKLLPETSLSPRNCSGGESVYKTMKSQRAIKWENCLAGLHPAQQLRELMVGEGGRVGEPRLWGGTVKGSGCPSLGPGPLPRPKGQPGSPLCVRTGLL